MVNLVWRMEFLLTECSYVMLEESVKTNFGMGTVYFLFSEKILAVWFADYWALAALPTWLWTYMKGWVNNMRMSFHEFPTKCPN